MWGKCMVKWKGGQLSEPWRYQCISVVSFMTTLGVAPTQTSLQMLEQKSMDHEQWSHRTWFPQGH